MPIGTSAASRLILGGFEGFIWVENLFHHTQKPFHILFTIHGHIIYCLLSEFQYWVVVFSRCFLYKEQGWTYLQVLLVVPLADNHAI